MSSSLFQDPSPKHQNIYFICSNELCLGVDSCINLIFPTKGLDYLLAQYHHYSCMASMSGWTTNSAFTNHLLADVSCFIQVHHIIFAHIQLPFSVSCFLTTSCLTASLVFPIIPPQMVSQLSSRSTPTSYVDKNAKERNYLSLLLTYQAYPSWIGATLPVEIPGEKEKGKI